MAAKEDFLADVHSRKPDWNISVYVIRKWEVPTKSNPKGLLSELNFSLHRAPIKIPTVQNEEPDKSNMMSKFQVDPTVNE
ncbi:hypothetical protein PIB30_054439 [Stylosanthes scabra]|uniref:Uncharacterized protein n=1 Tax=Stylosanthes scabra TaxID=79078 RepID=A0ABU6RJP1_9FABA|nr:hypothetical protein [Stylosanthes scabra]